jgi:hypothetical protein
MSGLVFRANSKKERTANALEAQTRMMKADRAAQKKAYFARQVAAMSPEELAQVQRKLTFGEIRKLTYPQQLAYNNWQRDQRRAKKAQGR